MREYPYNLEEAPNLPRTKDYFRWADYIELLCLSSQDGEFSYRDLEPYINQKLELVREGNDDDSHQRAFKGLEWGQRINDFFRILRYRQQCINNIYPFKLNKGNLLSLEKPFSLGNYFYVYLLFSSNLSYFNQYQYTFTSCFEEVAKHVVKKLLPPGAEVHIFGTARGESRYNGDLYSRICQLGQDIRVEVICKQENFQNIRGGDAGLDVVAWVPISDNASGIPVYFSQCACTVDKWKDKQHSVGLATWGNRFRWISPYTPMTVVPFSYRAASGLWENDDSIANMLMIDRDRIIILLNNDYQFFCDFEAYEQVKSLIDKIRK